MVNPLSYVGYHSLCCLINHLAVEETDSRNDWVFSSGQKNKAMEDSGLESLPPKFGLFFSVHTCLVHTELFWFLVLQILVFCFLRCSVTDCVNLFFFFFLLSSSFSSLFFSLFLFSSFLFLKSMKLLLLSISSDDSACHCSLIICLFFSLYILPDSFYQ